MLCFYFFFYFIVKVSIVSRFFDGAICAPRQPRYNQFIEWGLFVDKMTNLKEKIQRILLKKKDLKTVPIGLGIFVLLINV